MDVAFVVAGFAVLALAVLLYVAEEYRGKQVTAKRRVVVNLLDDRAITGVLWRRHKRLVVLRGAELVEHGREPVAMDGEIVIERDRISFTQVMGG